MKLDLNVIKKYKEEMTTLLRMQFPTLTIDEIQFFIEDAIERKFNNPDVRIDNNYKDIVVDLQLTDLVNKIETDKPILVPNGCLFKQHEEGFTPFYRLLESYVTKRKAYKKKMFEYPKGSDEFNKYNLLQLLAKRDGNATYGDIGSPASASYNLYVAVGTTATGRMLITHAISLFEQIFTNNLKFQNIDEAVVFLNRIIKEPSHIYSRELGLSRDIPIEEVYKKVIESCGVWVNDTEEHFSKYSDIIWNILMYQSQEVLNKIYYKNNLYRLVVDSSHVQDLVKNIFSGINEPFMNPNEPPDNIVESLNKLTTIFMEWCYMRYIVSDKFERCSTMTRDIVLLTDTDSSVISTDKWIHLVDNILVDHDCTLVNDLKEVVSKERKELYNFYTDEIEEVEEEAKITEGYDAVRISSVNILCYIVSKILKSHFHLIAEQYNTLTPYKVCLIDMKNEFLFKRALLTPAKKNYATIQELQEGNIVPKNKQMDIKGLPINKSVFKDSIKDELQGILREKVLLKPEVDQLEVIGLLAKIEKNIHDSIKSGEKDYYKPVSVKSISSYADPMRIQGIKAAIAYNEAIRDEGTEPIDLDSRNYLEILKVNIREKNIGELQQSNPAVYERLIKFFDNNRATYKGEILAVAVPADEHLPSWVLDYADYFEIINTNIKNFPLESIGITRFEKENVNYTNIITI